MDPANEFPLLVLTDFFFVAVCPNLTTLNESSGVITSPFYPRRYQNNQRCSWKITASEGKRVKLVIEDMNIEYHPTCGYDYLEVQGSSISGDGAPSGRMCRRLMGSVTYYSFRESLKVLFVSDGSVRYRGFKATYTQLSFSAFTSKQCNISY